MTARHHALKMFIGVTLLVASGGMIAFCSAVVAVSDGPGLVTAKVMLAASIGALAASLYLTVISAVRAWTQL